MNLELKLDNNGFLVEGNPTNMDINLIIMGKNFIFNHENSLIYQKGKYLSKRVVEIGDGSKLLKFLPRPEIFFQNINKEAFIMGMGVFQEFDEDTAQIKSYLYKFDKGEIQEFNDLFKIYGIQDCKVRIEGKFVLLDYEIPTFNDIKKQLFKRVSDKKYLEIFSFLYGMSLIYSNYHIEGDDFKSIKYHIPLIGGLTNQKEFFDKIFDFLWDVGIPNKVDIIQQKIGYIYQATISDWEMLNIFANFYKPLNMVHPLSKIKFINQMKIDLLNYIVQCKCCNIDFVEEIINRRIFKIIEK